MGASYKAYDVLEESGAEILYGSASWSTPQGNNEDEMIAMADLLCIAVVIPNCVFLTIPTFRPWPRRGALMARLARQTVHNPFWMLLAVLACINYFNGDGGGPSR